MKNRRITVGILFGGRSAEHEVSLESAKYILKAIDRRKYRPIPIGIDKSGRWLAADEAMKLIGIDHDRDIHEREDAVKRAPTMELCPVPSLSRPMKIPQVHVVFPVLHGPMGEDGTIQGMLKLAGLPFVGADVLGSAVGMDKDVMKRLLRDAGLPIARFMVHYTHEPAPSYHYVLSVLGSPFFVKPSNLGSSVGVSMVRDITEYRPALKKALTYDTKIILEETITGRELECALLGDPHPQASVPGEVVLHHGFYSYRAKYLDPSAATLKIPADISPTLAREIMTTAVSVYKILCCEGLGRVDFFLKPDGAIVVNEINTIPGFTAMSMYPKLWEASGVSSTELIHQLIQSAFHRHARQKRMTG